MRLIIDKSERWQNYTTTEDWLLRRVFVLCGTFLNPIRRMARVHSDLRWTKGRMLLFALIILEHTCNQRTSYIYTIFLHLFPFRNHDYGPLLLVLHHFHSIVPIPYLHRRTTGTKQYGTGFDKYRWAHYYYVRRPMKRTLRYGRVGVALRHVLLRRAQIVAVLRIWPRLLLIYKYISCTEPRQP